MLALVIVRAVFLGRTSRTAASDTHESWCQTLVKQKGELSTPVSKQASADNKHQLRGPTDRYLVSSGRQSWCMLPTKAALLCTVNVMLSQSSA